MYANDAKDLFPMFVSGVLFAISRWISVNPQEIGTSLAALTGMILCCVVAIIKISLQEEGYVALGFLVFRLLMYAVHFRHMRDLQKYLMGHKEKSERAKK